MTCDPNKILNTKVLETWVDGVRVWKNK